ncbi:Helix-turn-helix [Sinosporangium album]|uniref:Helix-turn-helix n=1 Tax=Sinosporangium album TaxID=504805 RepID=A0A1G8KBV0_9ACTN|nr:helix-turn-helix transcriptional regulator [Sinosporangium album]SDI40340.1 Helix-turn-helix [Sinosporangium album]
MPPVETVRHNGPSIRAWRRARGLTITALSKQIEITPSYLSKVERESKTSLSLALACRLASHLKVDLEVLLREKPAVQKKVIANGP